MVAAAIGGAGSWWADHLAEGDAATGGAANDAQGQQSAQQAAQSGTTANTTATSGNTGTTTTTTTTNGTAANSGTTAKANTTAAEEAAPPRGADASQKTSAAGLAALQGGTEAMKAWIQSQLGATPGNRDFRVDVATEKNAAFSRATVENWDALKKLIKEMPPEAQKQYESVANEEIKKSIQGSILTDLVAEENRDVTVREFSATGEGKDVVISLDPNVVKKASEFRRAENLFGQCYTDAQTQLQERKSTSLLGANGRIDFKWASTMGRYDDTKAVYKEKAATTDPQLRIDSSSVQAYLPVKNEAAKVYVKDTLKLPEDLQEAAAAGLTHSDYAQEYVTKQLDANPPAEGSATQATRVVRDNWGTLREKLYRLPEDIQKRYDGAADDGFLRSITKAFHADKKNGKDVSSFIERMYSSDSKGDFDYEFKLNSDGTVSHERHVEKDCVTDVVLPVIATVLTIIPATTWLGVAMNVALSTMKGIETGDWMSAGIGIVTSVAGGFAGGGGFLGDLATEGLSAVTSALPSAVGGVLEGAGGILSSASSAIGGFANGVANSVIGAGKGLLGATVSGAIGTAVNTVSGLVNANGFADALHKTYGLYNSAEHLSSAIEHGNVLGGLQAGASILGVVGPNRLTQQIGGGISNGAGLARGIEAGDGVTILNEGIATVGSVHGIQSGLSIPDAPGSIYKAPTNTKGWTVDSTLEVLGGLASVGGQIYNNVENGAPYDANTLIGGVRGLDRGLTAVNAPSTSRLQYLLGGVKKKDGPPGAEPELTKPINIEFNDINPVTGKPYATFAGRRAAYAEQVNKALNTNTYTAADFDVRSTEIDERLGFKFKPPVRSAGMSNDDWQVALMNAKADQLNTFRGYIGKDKLYTAADFLTQDIYDSLSVEARKKIPLKERN